MTRLTVPLLIPRQKARPTGDPGNDDRWPALCHLPQRGEAKDAAARAELVAEQAQRKLAGRQGGRRQQGLPPFSRRRPSDGFVIDRAKVEADPASTASSCYAPTPNRRPPGRSRTAIYGRGGRLQPARRYSPPPNPSQTDAGIRGHVFCTFLALVLRKELFDRLAAAVAGSNGSASSTILPTSVRSKSTGWPSGGAARRSGADHRPNLLRHRPHSAAVLPGGAVPPAA